VEVACGEGFHLAHRRCSWVLGDGTRFIDQPSSKARKTNSQTVLLVIEKEILIEAPDRLEIVSSYHEARTFY
jgi:hypothetical protein